MKLVPAGEEHPAVSAVSRALHELIDSGLDGVDVLAAAVGIAGVFASSDPAAVELFLKHFHDGVRLGRSEVEPKKEVACA